MELQGIKMGVLGDGITEGVGVVDEKIFIITECRTKTRFGFSVQNRWYR